MSLQPWNERRGADGRWTCPMCLRRLPEGARSKRRRHLCARCSIELGFGSPRTKPSGLRWAVQRTNGWTYWDLHRGGKLVGWVVAGPRYSEAVREPGATLMTGTLRECSDALVERAKRRRDD